MTRDEFVGCCVSHATEGSACWAMIPPGLSVPLHTSAIRVPCCEIAQVPLADCALRNPSCSTARVGVARTPKVAVDLHEDMMAVRVDGYPSVPAVTRSPPLPELA